MGQQLSIGYREGDNEASVTVDQEQSVSVEVGGESIEVENVSVSMSQQQSHHAVAQEQPMTTADIQTLVSEHREVFILTGLSGAGKSTAAQIIEEEHDENVSSFEMSDFVRAKYESEAEGYIDDNELGRWSAERKEEEGRGYFAYELAKTVKTPTTPHVVISGVRSPEEVEAIEDVFGPSTLVAIWTLPDTRFNRKYGEGKMSDEDAIEEFNERKERELFDWDGIEFFKPNGEFTADYFIPNHDDRTDLRNHIRLFLRGDGQYDVPPLPFKSEDVLASYL